MARCCCSFWEDADDADNADFDKDDDDNNIDDDDNNDDDDDDDMSWGKAEEKLADR